MKKTSIITFIASLLLVVSLLAVAHVTYAGGQGTGGSGSSGGTSGKGGGGGSGSPAPTGSGILSGSFTTDPTVAAAIAGAANSLCNCKAYSPGTTYSQTGGWGYSVGWSGNTNGGNGGNGGFFSCPGGGGNNNGGGSGTGGRGPSTPCPGGSLPQCSDKKDNTDPEDTLVDSADPGCHSDGNAANAASYNPSHNNEINVFVPPVITGPTKGCWINRPSTAASSCAMICGGAGGLASADPKGAQCMSGEARPASAIAALGSGRPPYWWGCWPRGTCAQPNYTQTSELTFPTTIRTCVGGYGGGYGCSGQNAIGTWVNTPGPTNSMCYAPGQKRDGDTTDLTTACFCQVPVAVSCSSGVPVPVVPVVPVAKAQCNDGIDNADFEDTLVDSADPGCHSDGNAANAASYNPADTDETDITQCNDGIDNDGDGKIDLPNDPDCVTNNGVSESAAPTITANGKSGGIIVRSGTNVVVDWKTNGGTNCFLSNNVTDNDSNPNNNGTNNVIVQNQSTFIITCNGLFDAVTVQVLPVIYES